MAAACKYKKVPPDGGWGWLVVLGCSIVNLFTRAIEPSFGLLFRDLLLELNVETAAAAVIMGTLDSIINFSGILVGPLMKVLSCRKVAMIGCFMTTLSYFLTITANSMAHLIISFSIIGGIGFGFGNASTFVALNSYFDKRKAQAVGLAMAGTALGFMFMPQIVSFLLIHYQFRGTLVILCGLAMNTFVGASLFQPIKWHMKTVEIVEVKEEKPLINDPLTIHEEEDEDEVENGGLVLSVSLEDEKNKPVGQQVSFPTSQIPLRRQSSITPALRHIDTNAQPRKLPKVNSAASLRRRPSMMSHVSLLDFAGSTMHIDYQDDDNGIQKRRPSTPGKPNEKEKPGWLLRIVQIMDLNLLKDTVYLNILYGASISYVAEFTWKLVLPFFLYDLGYDLQDAAFALTTMSVADLLARISMPPLLDRLPYSRRTVMMVCQTFLVVARSMVAIQTTTIPLMIALVVHGFIRGVTLIGFPLVLSEYANSENFPAVLGLSMVAKGIFIAVIAPIYGMIRDYTRSYTLAIHIQSLMILSCVVAWGIEYLVVKKKKDVEEDN